MDWQLESLKLISFSADPGDEAVLNMNVDTILIRNLIHTTWAFYCWINEDIMRYLCSLWRL